MVRGSSRILGSVSPGVRRRSVSLIDQNVVRIGSRAEARSLVQRYRHFSKHCVGRTVSVLDVSYTDIRPPRDGVVTLGELAVDRLG